MRKPIDTALKYYRQSLMLQDNQQNQKQIDLLMKTRDFKTQDKKIFEITVVKALNLRKPDQRDSKLMQVFYYFDFYTFGEYHSATVPGNNPEFNITSRYEVEYNQDFIDYLKSIKLVISFIDESVEMINTPNPNDLVGKAYVPLGTLLQENMKQLKL